jgi:glyoxylase-like metal-dependent hydrolase (beta-lactamase superfamily II)
MRLSSPTPLPLSVWPILLALAFVSTGCTSGFQSLQEPPGATAVTTGGPWTSMIYAARTDAGVVVVDLGWDGGDHLLAALDELGAEPEDVIAVFLTHTHRDHIAAWPLVAHASFHVAEPEVPYFLGQVEHRGTASRIASVIPPNLPEPGELDLQPFAGDTAFVLGADTLWAFHVPGHTPGSAAYLFRGIVFAGDALSYTRLRGFHAARTLFSDDVREARLTLDDLWRRLEPHEPRRVCTAHAMCADFESLLEEWSWADGREAATVSDASSPPR